ncbi:MAG: type II secretion system protein [Oscillatoriales cyanobacterium RM1_1_9]|nr:type II secretion system protein [Oscillatoriales cyanobacterium SM2_3_0]NJO71452.1 type II secretion system protein [Oscillatoriales cyanobacterium RM1_1_9]
MEAGFSLIEVAVVVLMTGILAAIAAPSWDALTSRQRVRSVNSQVLQVMRQAQAEAKRTKANYKVEFDVTQDPPEYSVHLATATPVWQTLNVDGEVKAGMVELAITDPYPSTQNGVVFNYLGNLEDEEDVNFQVTVRPKDNTNNNAKRCVKAVTLLGLTEIFDRDACD